jgi:hypothetical protein
VTPYGYDARRDTSYGYATIATVDGPMLYRLDPLPKLRGRPSGPVLARVTVPAPGMRPARCTRPGQRPRGYQARRMIA